MENAEDANHRSRAEDKIGYNDEAMVIDPSGSYFLGLPLIFYMG